MIEPAPNSWNALFDVEVNRHGVSEVDVFDGLVDVANPAIQGSSVLLPPGFSTRVGLGTPPEPPVPTYEIPPSIDVPEEIAKQEFIRERDEQSGRTWDTEFGEPADSEVDEAIDESGESEKRTTRLRARSNWLRAPLPVALRLCSLPGTTTIITHRVASGLLPKNWRLEPTCPTPRSQHVLVGGPCITNLVLSFDEPCRAVGQQGANDFFPRWGRNVTAHAKRHEQFVKSLAAMLH